MAISETYALCMDAPIPAYKVFLTVFLSFFFRPVFSPSIWVSMSSSPQFITRLLSYGNEFRYNVVAIRPQQQSARLQK